MKKTLLALLVLSASVSAMAKVDTREICQNKRKDMIKNAEAVINKKMEEKLRSEIQKLYQTNNFSNVESISFLSSEDAGGDIYTGTKYKRNNYRVNAGSDSIEIKEIHYVQFARFVEPTEEVDALGRVKSVTCTIRPTGSDSAAKLFFSYVDNKDSDKRLFEFTAPLPYEAFSSVVKL